MKTLFRFSKSLWKNLIAPSLAFWGFLVARIGIAFFFLIYFTQYQEVDWYVYVILILGMTIGAVDYLVAIDSYIAVLREKQNKHFSILVESKRDRR